MGYYFKLASAIFNDIMSGLRGYTSTSSISLDQLEDDIIDERLQIIKEYSLKGLIPKKDLLMSINCINVDCKNLENCTCGNSIELGTPTFHFEVPQLLTEFDGGIEYIGSVDKGNPFLWYTSPTVMQYHKYRKKAKNKPYVYIDTTPNNNNMYDCWIFNIPIIKQISVIGVFKDPRQLMKYGCCTPIDINNMTYIDAEIKKRLTEKKIRYYRQLAANIMPNTQEPR